MATEASPVPPSGMGFGDAVEGPLGVELLESSHTRL